MLNVFPFHCGNSSVFVDRNFHYGNSIMGISHYGNSFVFVNYGYHDWVTVASYCIDHRNRSHSRYLKIRNLFQGDGSMGQWKNQETNRNNPAITTWRKIVIFLWPTGMRGRWWCLWDSLGLGARQWVSYFGPCFKSYCTRNEALQGKGGKGVPLKQPA